ncbi:Gag protease polyprotein-like protein [Gossypium australe]|uniref:Gag protease polyprotein-like protein n=1 Tax=Gossypium australe TaxID=47621 RepID=A0A5B6WIU8_9ROSI|nr:Gag protease polyprotein-like protein [Gossypium australe]
MGLRCEVELAESGEAWGGSENSAKCRLRIQGCEFLGDLMLLPFHEFDLTLHDVVVNYRQKWIVLRCQNGIVESNRTDFVTNVISAMSTQKLVRKGCVAFLAYILDTQISESKIDQLLMANKFTNLFLEELSRTAPISIAPYRMASIELKELKSQLQELIDR